MDLDYGWKVFYVDDDNVYLIYADCYPHDALQNIGDGFNVAKDTKGSCGIHAIDSRDNLISYLATPSNWSAITTEFQTGTNSKFKNISNITTIGSPTIDMWMNSWNISKPDNEPALGYREVKVGDGKVEYYNDSNEIKTVEATEESKQGVLLIEDKNAVPEICRMKLALGETSLYRRGG